MPPRVAVLAVGLALVVAGCAGSTGDMASVTTSTSPPQVSSPTSVVTAATSSTTAPPSPGTTIVFGDSSLVVVPDESGAVPPELEVGCASGPTFPVAALSSIEPLLGSGRAHIEAAIAGFLGSGEGAFWPQVDQWLVLHETEEQVLLVFVDPSVPTVGFQEVQLVEGVWTWSGAQMGGSCPLEARLPVGLNRVAWRIDPEYGLDPAGTTVHLLATERECASGQAMGDRLHPTNAVITSTEVRITLVADPPPGDFQTCQGNPEQPVVLDLGVPLGDRQVVDGLTVLGDLVELVGRAG